MESPLFITGLDEAEGLLLGEAGPAVEHLISIGAPGTALPEGFERCPSRLRLEFADIGRDYGAPGLALPTLEHARAIIAFAESLRGTTGTLLVHCAAGVSRSTAAALIVLATWLGPGREESAVAQVLSAQPRAQPNRLLVRHGDAALGRGGALLEALRAGLFTAPR